MTYIFDLEKLDQTAKAYRENYSVAAPYPHIVLDNFLKEESARRILEDFPGSRDGIHWDQYGYEGYEIKIATSREEQFPSLIKNALHDLNSGPFIRFLQALTGIEHLFADPHMLGGGLHLVGRNGLLGIHADFNWHPELLAHRRINLLIYFNENWLPEYNGDLELWSPDAGHCVKSIAPVFNRAVIFSTTSDSFHGHPKPLALPEGQWRRSIAMYYYTAQRPESEIRDPHNTRYKGLHLE